MTFRRCRFTAGLAGIVAACALLAAQSEPSTVAQLRSGFAHPPDNARMMMRWWWFGPAVKKPELSRELHVMKQAGIGGVEIQPVYPLALDDPAHGFRNAAYLSDEFLGNLRYASREARQLGLRVDITLGSGWPYGGPDTPVTQAAGRLRCDRVPVPASAYSLPLPSLESGETLIAAFLADGTRTQIGGKEIKRLTDVQGGRLQIPSGLEGPHVVLFFISSRSGMQVKRAGVGAEGFVLDHYERAAIEQHLSKVGNRLMEAFSPEAPYAVFSDSLEVFGSDWTSDLPDEFRKRRGYDLTPYLPALITGIGEQTEFIRHDWGRTLTELAEERYLVPIRDWARAHHTLFRSQTYGVPPVVLSSNALVDLAEGEAGPRWRTFNTARWASSANHLYGRPITSSETWTWLHSPAFRATPLDMKAEADLHFVEGINQLIGHGWPYSPASASEPGWRFYAAAAFNEHNPWFSVMPDITAYVQRISFLMRQGSPANDIGIYLPTDDAWAQFTSGNISVDHSMEALIGPKVIPQVLNAGHNFDFVDDKAIAAVAMPYRILIFPRVERIPLATLQKLGRWTSNGGVLIATRRTPSIAPGLMEERTETASVKELSGKLFNGTNPRARFVQDEDRLLEILNAVSPPDLTFSSGASSVGFIHRKLASGDIYFLVNTTNQGVNANATFRIKGLAPEVWDPFTGSSDTVPYEQEGENTSLSINLAPYESRTFVFLPGSRPVAAVRKAGSKAAPLDLATNWKVTYSKGTESEQMEVLHSWADEPKHRYYSGEAVYEKDVEVPPAFLESSRPVSLDFGEGRALEMVSKPGPGMQAWMDGPVREAAVVYINGQKAGYVWHPPYRVRVEHFLHSGVNHVQIVAGNSAVNELAGQASPDYRLLNLRYGIRFTPQDMEGLKPLPSGVVGPLKLIAE